MPRKFLVPKAGFEPARVTPHAPQTCVSTRFHHFGKVIYATTMIDGFSSLFRSREKVSEFPYEMSCLLTLIFTLLFKPST